MKLALLMLLPSNIDDLQNISDDLSSRFNLFDCVHVAASDIRENSSRSDCNIKYWKVKSSTVIDALSEVIFHINSDYVFLLCRSDKLTIDSLGVQLLRKIIYGSQEPVSVFGAFEFYKDNISFGVSAELSAYPDGIERECFVNRELDKSYDSALSGLVLSKNALLKNIMALRLLSGNTLSPVFIAAIDGTDRIYQIKTPTVITTLEKKNIFPEFYNIVFYYYQWLFCNETFLKRRLLRKLFDTVFVSFKLNKVLYFLKIFSILNYIYRPTGFFSFPFAFVESVCCFAGRRLAGIMRHS